METTTRILIRGGTETPVEQPPLRNLIIGVRVTDEIVLVDEHGVVLGSIYHMENTGPLWSRMSFKLRDGVYCHRQKGERKETP